MHDEGKNSNNDVRASMIDLITGTLDVLPTGTSRLLLASLRHINVDRCMKNSVK